jgi:hypothetical protein
VYSKSATVLLLTLVALPSDKSTIYISQQARFTDIGNSILGRMEEFDQRMDALESSIATLMDKAGLEHNLKREPSSTNAEVAKHRSSPESMEI